MHSDSDDDSTTGSDGMPENPKTALTFFIDSMVNAGGRRSFELIEKWQRMSDDEKAPYVKQAADDELRFKRELREMLMLNVRERASVNPKTAWTIILDEQRALRPQADIPDAWAAMSDEQKAPYHKRYQDQLNAMSADDIRMMRMTRSKRRDKITPSPFMLFSAEKRESVTKSNHGAMMTQVAAIIGKMWIELSPEEKKHWTCMRAQLKIEQDLRELQL
jgi:hypothetical protein